MTHLTLEQRYRIEIGLDNGFNPNQIALNIGKDRSVIYREINRNSDQRNGEYRAKLAQKKTNERHSSKKKRKDFTLEIEEYVKDKIKLDYSPEQIVGRAKLEGENCVSHETIYQYIWRDKKQKGTLYKHLRNKGKRYRKRGSAKDTRGLIKERVDIENRPEIVDKKERVGDLEIDLVIGKSHKQALLTINDRVTGVLWMSKVLSKEASEIEKKTIQLLDAFKPIIHTITSDNGKEFANHKNIAEKLEIDFFFAKPYHSWQRGANENLNGLVRQYFPKKLNFDEISMQEIQQVQNKINQRPRKRLGFKTPNEFFAEKLEKMALVHL